MPKVSAPAKKIAAQTSDAYSAGRYKSWAGVAYAIKRLGYTDAETITIMRSKITRWAADQSDAPYGRAPATVVVDYLVANPGVVQSLLNGEGGI